MSLETMKWFYLTDLKLLSLHVSPSICPIPHLHPCNDYNMKHITHNMFSIHYTRDQRGGGCINNDKMILTKCLQHWKMSAWIHGLSLSSLYPQPFVPCRVPQTEPLILATLVGLQLDAPLWLHRLWVHRSDHLLVGVREAQLKKSAHTTLVIRGELQHDSRLSYEHPAPHPHQVVPHDIWHIPRQHVIRPHSCEGHRRPIEVRRRHQLELTSARAWRHLPVISNIHPGYERGFKRVVSAGVAKDVILSVHGDGVLG